MNNTNSTEANVIAGFKVIKVMSLIGACASGFGFGFNIYHHNIPNVIAFALIGLVCGLSFTYSFKKN